MDQLKNLNDFSHKYVFSPKFLLQYTNENMFNFEIKLSNDRTVAMKSRFWLDNFFENSVLSSAVKISHYYKKADKITSKNKYFFLDMAFDILFFDTLLKDVNSQFTDPSIIAGEHGYDLITRIHKFSLSVMLRYDQLNIINNYILLLRLFQEGKIYASR